MGQVKPIPISIIHRMYLQCMANGDAKSLTLTHMAYVAFYFLTLSSQDSHPFSLQDIRLWVGGMAIDPLQSPFHVLHRSTFVGLIFSEQKNCVCGEMIVHGAIGHHYAFLVQAMMNLIIILRNAGGGPTTPLQMYRPFGGAAVTLTATDMTEAL